MICSIEATKMPFASPMIQSLRNASFKSDYKAGLPLVIHASLDSGHRQNENFMIKLFLPRELGQFKETTCTGRGLERHCALCYAALDVKIISPYWYWVKLVRMLTKC